MPTRRQIANRKNASKPRLPKRLRRAIELMVHEGKSRALAASEAGMSDSGLRQALRRPHVRSLMAQEFSAIRDAEAFAAFGREVHLAENADSEHVKHAANIWIAGCAGLAPIQKLDARHEVTHRFEGITFGSPPVEIQAEAAVEDARVVEAETVEVVDQDG